MRELDVSDVAALTGLTVRTLHHYDRLGLVTPARTAAGHRKYTSVDIERIYRVQAMRRLGLRLRDIRGLIDATGAASLRDVVVDQLDHTRAEIAELNTHADRLSAVLAAIDRADPPRAEDLLTLIASTAMLNSELRHDYSNQAHRYDTTRGVSASILVPVVRWLDDAPGRTVWDIGGGTGNYAVALRDLGWDVTVADVSDDMRRAAEIKGLRVVAADATDLPVSDESVDAVVMISMLHQVPDWRAALDEAARVLRRGGRLAVQVLTADHLRDVTWAFDFFPSMARFAVDRRMSVADLAGALPGAEVWPLPLTDVDDVSIAVLCARPELMLDERRRRQTSFFERLERDNPAELAAGLERLRRLLMEGRSPLDDRSAARNRLGDTSLLTWTKQ